MIDTNDGKEHAGPLPRSAQSAPANLQGEQVVSNSSPLRRGKWTSEEEAYALAAIRDFNSGYLDAPPGTTLRTYLSEKLQCDPMRITKKFTGEASIGKKVFHPAVRDDPKILQNIKNSQAKLEHLYKKWKQRLEYQEQEMARKSMAAEAVSVASSLCNNSNVPLFSSAISSSRILPMGVTPIAGNEREGRADMNPNAHAKSEIAKAATWLEKAESILSKETECSLVKKEIEDEMREISVLIKDAPEILAMSAELPNLLGKSDSNTSGNYDQTSISGSTLARDADYGTTKQSEQLGPITSAGKRKRIGGNDSPLDSPNASMKLLASLSSQAAPVPIDSAYHVSPTPNATNPGDQRVNAEDAKTFVNFLQRVEHVNKK
ncbi:hypothetical protein ACHAWF_004227 [Thalassiosira exigua]